MNGELLQLITLTAFGNAALFQHLHDLPNPERLPARHFQGHVLQFDGVGDLRQPDRKRAKISYLNNSKAFDEWIKYLVRDGAQHLSLGSVSESRSLPAHVASAFVNGHRQSIIVEYQDHAAAWTPYWTYNEPPQRKTLTIRCQNNPLILTKPASDLQECKQKLRSVLLRAADFATRAGGKHWAKIFHKALSQLETEVPTTAWAAFPSRGYSLEAWQLVVSVSEAWVFGGMGSWNDWIPDLPLPAQEGDNSITEDLFSCLNECLVMATNSFDGNCIYRPPHLIVSLLISTLHQLKTPTQWLSSIRMIFQVIIESPVITYVALFALAIAIQYVIFLLNQ